jgi:hypothetical protein
MAILNKTIYLTILTAIIIAGSLLSVNPVQAQPNILVEIWNKQTNNFEALETRPIFDVSNFLPGGAETERLKITNNSSESQTVGFNVTDFEPGCVDGYCLADELILTVTKVSNGFSCSASLTEFYEAGEIPLSEVSGNGGNVEYDFSVYFQKEAAAKEYQNLTTNFDLKIGFLEQATSNSSGGFNFTKNYDEDDTDIGVVKGAEDEQIKEPEGEEIGILPRVGPYFPWICLLALVISGITLKTKRLIDA